MSLIENLNMEQLEAILDTIPIDVTFCDANDLIQYCNKSEKKEEMPPLMGKPIQNCHPEGHPLDTLNQMLSDFRNGKIDTVETWKTFGDGKRRNMRWFAVRNKAGKYLGTISALYNPGPKLKMVEREGD